MIGNQTTDSREKLEADARALQTRIWQAGANNDDISLSHIIELLDRQAAITERHWIEIAGASANANIELKHQIDELDKALNEVAEKWAIAQVETKEYMKRFMLLKELVRDMWREMITCPDYATSPCMTSSICERVRNFEIEV